MICYFEKEWRVFMLPVSQELQPLTNEAWGFWYFGFHKLLEIPLDQKVSAPRMC